MVNSGAGASNGHRASFSQQFTTPITMSTVFGSSKPSWIDPTFLPA
jgi:hypothetical protein